MPGDYSLELTWVKGHTDSIGNGLADEEAQASAADNTNPVADLPSFLSSAPLPISSSASKQKYVQELKVWWKYSWACSPCFPKLSKTDPTMLSNKFQKLIIGLGRVQASLFAQMHTGHVPLIAYLHRINKIDTLCAHPAAWTVSPCTTTSSTAWCGGQNAGTWARHLGVKPSHSGMS